MEAVQAFDDFRWGLRSFHAGNFEDSILSFEKSLSRKPMELRTRYWLASALYRAGYEDAALAEWRYQLERDPGNAAVDNIIDVLTFRRGLGEQLEERTPFVVASEIDGTASSAYPMRRPSSVWIREDGSVYVVAFASNELLLLDVNNAVRKVFQGGVRGFDRPYDCLEASDPLSGERFLFVAEYGRNQLLKLDLQGERILSIGGKGGGPGELLGPQYLATDGKGYLYVSDWGNGRVSKYDFDGNFVLSIGRSAKPGLGGPTGLAYREGELFVADSTMKRIVAYDDSGNALYSFGAGVLSGPEGIAFSGPNHLLVVDGSRLLEYDLSRETWSTLSDMSAFAGRLTHLALSPNGEVYVVDFDANRVYILSEMAALYTSLYVQVDRINTLEFPKLQVEVSVENRQGRPIVGLRQENFIFSEFFRELPAARLLRSPSDPAPLEVSLVVEQSPAMGEYRADLTAAVDSLYGQLAAQDPPGSWRVIGAGEQAVEMAGVGASRLESIQAAATGSRNPLWRLDRGLRLATSRLLTGTNRKAVVLLTTGILNRESFSEYGLAEITDYLQNNSIPLYVVAFAPRVSRELAYICEQSGGMALSYYAAKSVVTLMADILGNTGSRYVFEARSVSDAGFGRNYIDFHAEVVFHRKSGRTQSGYFAPLSD